MKIIKVRFLKDWVEHKKGDVLTNNNGEFSTYKEKYIEGRRMGVLSYTDICYLLNSGSLAISEILTPNKETEIIYYV